MSDRPRQRPPRSLRGALSIRDMPEVLAAYRHELANLLREAAMDEPPAIAAFAERIAALFETGLDE